MKWNKHNDWFFIKCYDDEIGDYPMVFRADEWGKPWNYLELLERKGFYGQSQLLDIVGDKLVFKNEYVRRSGEDLYNETRYLYYDIVTDEFHTSDKAIELYYGYPSFVINVWPDYLGNQRSMLFLEDERRYFWVAYYYSTQGEYHILEYNPLNLEFLNKINLKTKTEETRLYISHDYKWIGFKDCTPKHYCPVKSLG